MKNEYIKGLSYVWLIFSLIFVSAIIISALPFRNVLLSQIPECESKVKYGTECSLCGMTTGFELISQGDIKGAVNKNRYSVFVYALFLLNTVLVAVYLLRRVLLKKR